MFLMLLDLTKCLLAALNVRAYLLIGIKCEKDITCTEISRKD